MLGEQIRKARLKAGLTQEDLAFRAKVSRQYVSLIELDRKNPTVAVLLQLCRAMGTKASSMIQAIENHRLSG